MICPKCKGKTKVIDSVNNTADNETYRLRKCVECEHQFYTTEYEVDMNATFKRTWWNYHRYNSKNRTR